MSTGERWILAVLVAVAVLVVLGVAFDLLAIYGGEGIVR